MPYLVFLLVYFGEPLVVAMTSDITYADAMDDAFVDAFFSGIVAVIASETVGFFRS